MRTSDVIPPIQQASALHLYDYSTSLKIKIMPF